MAARAPSAFTKYINHRNFIAKENVRETEIDKIFDDQEFCISKGEILYIDNPRPFGTTSTSFVNIGNVAVRGVDLMAGGTNGDAVWAVKIWNTGVGTAKCEFKLTNVSTADTVTINNGTFTSGVSTAASPKWTGYQTGANRIDFRKGTAGTGSPQIHQYQLDLRSTDGEPAWFGGIIIFSDEA